MTNYAAEVYVSPRERELTPYEGWVRMTAILIKDGNYGAIQAAAWAMKNLIPEGAVLVPMPSSEPAGFKGSLLLADALADLTGGRRMVLVQRRRGVRSSRELRRSGGRGLAPETHAMTMGRTPYPMPPADVPIVMVDNVVVSGATFEGARRVLGRPDAIGVAFARGKENTLPRVNPDSNIRDLERRAATGDPEARAQLRRARQRLVESRDFGPMFGVGYRYGGGGPRGSWVFWETDGGDLIATDGSQGPIVNTTRDVTGRLRFNPPRGDARLRQLERAWFDADDWNAGAEYATLLHRVGREQDAREVEADLAWAHHYRGPRDRNSWLRALAAYDHAYPGQYGNEPGELSDDWVGDLSGKTGGTLAAVGDSNVPGGRWFGSIALGPEAARRYFAEEGDGDGEDDDAVNAFRWIRDHARAIVEFDSDDNREIRYYRPTELERFDRDWGDADYFVNEWEDEQGEDEADQPAPDDIVISDAPPLGSRTAVDVVEGPHLGTFNTDEAAWDAIRAHQQQAGWWGNVWRLDDHGGLDVVGDPQANPPYRRPRRFSRRRRAPGSGLHFPAGAWPRPRRLGGRR